MAILAGMKRFDLKLADIRVEGTGPNPSDQSIVCWLTAHGALVRYRLDRVEVWTTPKDVSEERTSDLIEDAIGVVQLANPNSRVSDHSVSLTIHGRLPSGTVSDRIATYVSEPQSEEPRLRPTGVSFGWVVPDDGEASVVLEHSALVPDGLFLRFTSVQRGTVSPRAAYEKATEFFRAAFARFKMEPRWVSP